MAKDENSETNEAVAKIWMINAVSNKIDDVKTSQTTDNDEIKALIRELSITIKNELVTKEQMETQIKLVHKEYAPTKKAVIWLGTTVALIVISYFFQLFVNITQQVGTK